MPIDEKILKVIRNNDPVDVVDLSYQNLNDLDMEKLRDVMKVNNTLRVLKLAQNNIGPNGAIALATALKSTNVVTVDLSDNCIGDEGAIALASCSNLRELNLHANQVSDVGAQALGCSALVKLNISFNDIGFVGIKALIDSSTIASLNFFRNKLNTKQLEVIAMRILRTNVTLTEAGFECNIFFLNQLEARYKYNQFIATLTSLMVDR